MPGNFPGALPTRGHIYYCCCRALASQTQVRIPDFRRWLLRVWWHQMSPLVHKISTSHLALVPTCSPMIMILLGSRNTFRIIKSVLRVLSEMAANIPWNELTETPVITGVNDTLQWFCLGCSWKSLGETWRYWLLVPTPMDSDLIGLWWGLGIRTFFKAPGDSYVKFSNPCFRLKNKLLTISPPYCRE